VIHDGRYAGNIVNGKVFVGTPSGVAVFGLF
jgi:hypothetical protein